jgi:hypothetical protein
VDYFTTNNLWKTMINWIKGAINPEHKGFCTPMTKSTCTPRRKALAMRFKKGGDLHAKRKFKRK